MTMITCLILWIPGGTTYVPDGPPATRAGLAAGRLAAAGLDDEHPASRAAVATATIMTQPARMPRRLAAITALPEMPRALVPRALVHADLPATKYLKSQGWTSPRPPQAPGSSACTRALGTRARGISGRAVMAAR